MVRLGIHPQGTEFSLFILLRGRRTMIPYIQRTYPHFICQVTLLPTKLNWCNVCSHCIINAKKVYMALSHSTISTNSHGKQLSCKNQHPSSELLAQGRKRHAHVRAFLGIHLHEQNNGTCHRRQFKLN